MPNLFKKCVSCELMRNEETEYHYNGAKYSDGKKRKRLDCVYCCRERRSKYFKDPVKRRMINERRRNTYGEDRQGKNRKNALQALYGLTLEQYDLMREQQNFSCAVCKAHESTVFRKKLYVDHCHATNKIRGLLCAACNSAIGLLKESIETLNNSIEYLTKNKK